MEAGKKEEEEEEWGGMKVGEVEVVVEEGEEVEEEMRVEEGEQQRVW